MKKTNTWRRKRSFGPAILHEEGSSLRAICTWCTFRVGDTCTHVRPSRLIPDPENTPEWCKMREAMLQDAKEQIESAQERAKVAAELAREFILGTQPVLADTEERQSGEKAMRRHGTSSPVRDSQPTEGEVGPCPPKSGNKGDLLVRAQRYIDRNADTGPETMVIELVQEIERLRKILSEIAGGYIGDQSAEEQFLWAQRLARAGVQS